MKTIYAICPFCLKVKTANEYSCCQLPEYCSHVFNDKIYQFKLEWKIKKEIEEENEDESNFYYC